jgi:hypothetical protein
VKKNRVTDHEAVVVAGDELLRLIHLEVLERVDAEIREQLQRVRSLDVQIRHVMRLVEQRTRLSPRPLFVAPVGELRPDHRERVRPRLRMAQQLNGIAGGLQHVFETSRTHRSSYSWC